MNRVIGLTGHMGAGKDVVAGLLKKFGYARISFADEIRREIYESLIWGHRPKGIPAELARDLDNACASEVWLKPTSERMRRILQRWGFDYRRRQDPDYWVDRALAGIDGVESSFVISDVRFPNEVAAVRDRGGVLWKIDRPCILGGIEGHPTESGADVIECDVTIHNTGTLMDLCVLVMNAL